MNTFWIILSVVVGIALLSVVFYFSLNLIFYNISLSKNSMMKSYIEKRMKKNFHLYKVDYMWFEKKRVEHFKIRRDKLTLHANFYERKDDNKLAIICHGYAADYREMSMYAKYFYNRGFSILLPEFRAHGKSEGKTIGMGWPDRLDLKKWIEFMVDKNPNYEIVLFGLSMGASTVCMAVGEDLPENVKCAISDCAYDNVYDQFEFVSSRMKMVNSKFIMKVYNNFLKRAFEIDLVQFDAIRQVKKAKIPMLFIHGDADEFVPYDNLQRLYNAHPLEKHKYIYTCKGAGHALSYAKDEDEYEKQINQFLKKEYYHE